MASKMMRTCRVCGKQYKACLSCQGTESWKSLADTENHYKILVTLMDYQYDQDAEKAKGRLQRCNANLNAKEGYIPSVLTLLQEISEKTGGDKNQIESEGTKPQHSARLDKE